MNQHSAFTEDNVAVITGGADGIGFAAAQYFQSIGMRICIADINPDKLQQAKQFVANNMDCSLLTNDGAGNFTMTALPHLAQISPGFGVVLRDVDLDGLTDCYIVPANWPEARREHWMTLLRARAIENQAYVVGVNRVGSAGRLDYSGDTRIIDPLGGIVEAPSGEVSTIIADVDPAEVARVRAEFPFMQDRGNA